MRTTKYYLFTTRNVKNNSFTSISHQLMLRAGLIRQTSSGIYTWLPTGIKVIRKIENIIRYYMNELEALEIHMPILHSQTLWKKSKRLITYGNELFKLNDRKNNQFILAPTHEEIITNLIKHEIHSYKQLPIIFYQIQNKYRDEIRPRFGVIRSREFIMKDAYSFHIDSKSLKLTYEKVMFIYTKILKKMNLKFNITQVDSNLIGGDISHEFQTHSNIKKNLKKEQLNIKQELLKEKIEVGHIFQIGQKYSSIFNFTIQNKLSQKILLTMGCYGIGISRLVAAIIEQHHDDKGIIWPDIISPFQIVILPINLYKSEKVKKKSEKLYKILKNNDFEVLFDDRNESIGMIFNDMELIGIPHQLIVSESLLKNNEIEYRDRKTKIPKIINFNNLLDFFIKIYQR